MRTLARAAIVAGLLLGACSSEQDPGIAPAPDATSTTSRALPSCPPGGPDATTPPAGCLDDDGNVVRA